MVIGKQIRQAREGRGWSQPELARHCGWDSQSRISQYESNAREPKLADLQKIADALDLSLAELLGPEKGASGASQEDLTIAVSSDEYVLLKRYRRLCDRDRDHASAVIDALSVAAQHRPQGR